MNHKQIFSLLLFFYISLSFINAQEDKKQMRAEYKIIKPLVKSAVVEAKSKKSMTSYQAFMDTVKVISPRIKGYILGRKFDLLVDFNKKKLRNLEPQKLEKEPFMKELTILMQQMIDTCEYCRLHSMAGRYEFLKQYDIGAELRKKDSMVIFPAGFKPEINGSMIGLRISQGKDTWIGGEFAIKSFFQPFYRLKKWNKTHTTYEIADTKTPFAANLLSIAYAYNWKQKVHDLSFNLLQFTSPLVFKPLQFGVQKRTGFQERIEPYYRPVIGLGFGRISASAGYNIMFRKSARENAEKWMFNLNFIFPIK